MQFLLSMGPFSNPKEKDVFRIDHKDDAVRGALVLEGGELRWPAPPLPAPAAPPPKKEEVAKKELTPEEIYADTLKSALTTSALLFLMGWWWGKSCCCWAGLLPGAAAFCRTLGLRSARCHLDAHYPNLPALYPPFPLLQPWACRALWAWARCPPPRPSLA